MYVVDESSPIQPKDTEPSRDIVLGLISKPTLDGESRQLAKNRRGLIMDFDSPDDLEVTRWNGGCSG